MVVEAGGILSNEIIMKWIVMHTAKYWHHHITLTQLDGLVDKLLWDNYACLVNENIVYRINFEVQSVIISWFLYYNASDMLG